jgi:pimeloyl-ACP methyl ester carboxylesterase
MNQGFPMRGMNPSDIPKRLLIDREHQARIMQTDVLLNVKGGTVFARRWKPTFAISSTPLIFLHDSLGCVDLWRDFPAILAEQLSRPVVAYDRLGFGRSSAQEQLPSADFIREEAEELLPAVLNELGIDEFALFGHSVGGAMALLAASRAGDRCQAVVSESAQAFVENHTVAGIRAARERFQDLEQFQRIKKWHGTRARWVLDAWTEVWLSSEFESWSLKPDLPLVKCPVLIIHGAEDEFGSIRFPETICHHVGGPAEMHILSDCGHVPHRERREDVVGLIARFPPLSGGLVVTP